ncbi:MAG: hypothetical protein CME62_13140 [Halobacteriovoraceae bacterium]|nr:hypothetical protein [Halobacteriovoraceae bacterium]|tara:strand:- start:12373 stop:12891 length:519 start_codon:yes stop_codon:yes gene_type:complete
MKKNILDLIDTLLDKSENSLSLRALEQVLNFGIPFNTPHKFKFNEMSEQKTRLELPFIRKNKNHLGGIHACAIATLGEYTAGLSLIKFMGISRYRLIMSHLEVDYYKQARGKVWGEIQIESSLFQNSHAELNEKDRVEIELATHILNEENEIIALVKTKWQLKNWQKVTFKG